MTACTMASDYGMELLLGTSPVLTSSFHTAGGSFFSDYSNRYGGSPSNGASDYSSQRCGSSPGVLWDTTTTTSSYFSTDALVGQLSELSTADNCRTYARTGSLRRSKKLERLKKEFAQSKPLLLTSPSKSCLRQIDEQEDSSVPLNSPTKEKKKVCFADALGQNLTQIKLITERPDCPPLWSTDFIEKVTGGIAPDSPKEEWELTFAQPVADYVNFKNKLDNENVTLENVFLDKKKKGTVKGTISVRNLSFHKDVTVRYTTNNWVTTTDCPAAYVPSQATCSAYDLYDRFSFEFALPRASTSDKVEFCIRFSCDGIEYWDNNGGRNYILISFKSKKDQKSGSKFNDPYRLNIDSFSEYASWNSSESETPYW